MTNIQTMSIKNRAGIAGRHIVTCSLPAVERHHGLMTGNGTLLISALGHPFEEELVLMREGLLVPQWKEPPSAPKIAKYLPMIRSLIKQGRYKEAAELSDTAAAQNGCAPEVMYNRSHPALVLSIKQPYGDAKEYLQTMNMRTSVIHVQWDGKYGMYSRDIFCSRKDQIAVIRLKAPTGKLNVAIAGSFPEMKTQKDHWTMLIPPEVTVSHSEKGILLHGTYAYDRGGFATAVRVCIQGNGTASANNESVIISDADEALIMICCEINRKDAVELLMGLEKLSTDFDALLKGHTEIHTPLFDRLSVDLGGNKEDYLLSTVELKQKQFLSRQIIPAYMEAMVDMGRFFLLNESGQFPPIYGHVNTNVNHQISGGNIGNLAEMMESFFRWIEGQLSDARENAQNILGTRGIFIACHPDEESGKLNHFSEYWPHHYWISSTGWCLNPFLEHYYCTGDEQFLKNRLLPLYKELALLYEDFLVERDEHGKLIFIPSYSPENSPLNLHVAAVINATMDISVCREVLTVLLTLGRKHDIGNPGDYERWQKILDDMPDYLFGPYGELKEWAHEDFEERFDHRHISHLYGAYPGDEFQPEQNEALYRAAFIANRMRSLGNGSVHGLMHRAQIAARLKDPWLLENMVRFILESGYVNDGFTTAHNPYYKHVAPDGQGALPTVVLESLCYARPGFVEILPALLDNSFRHGTLTGMSLRSFAILDRMSWDLDKKTVVLHLTSHVEQKIILCYRKGIVSLETTGVIAVQRIDDNSFEMILPQAGVVTIDLETSR
jgi:hypothetical protein